MKKAIKCIILSFFFVFAGCSASSSPEAVTNNFFQCLENGDLHSIEQYVDSSVSEDLTDSLTSLSSQFGDEDILDNEQIQSVITETLKAMFQKHEITSVTEVSDTKSTVEVSITGLDSDGMESISELMLENLTSESLAALMMIEDESELMKQVIQLFTDTLKENAATYASEYSVTITVEKTDGKWLITDLAD